MDVVRRAATVTGRVQGVSFRWYTEQRATALGLTGWVRNHHDGSVRLEAQGPEAAVAELVAWLHQGPPHARVDDVRVQPAGTRPGEAGFRTVG
ncbi:MAG TPA: acylphosphatase [Acidimicrobiales bacterium]|nr:acylphosphatase [Acidimicrobiales bacterium]